jgi:hypothetical protein
MGQMPFEYRGSSSGVQPVKIDETLAEYQAPEAVPTTSNVMFPPASRVKIVCPDQGES